MRGAVMRRRWGGGGGGGGVVQDRPAVETQQKNRRGKKITKYERYMEAIGETCV